MRESVDKQNEVSGWKTKKLGMRSKVVVGNSSNTKLSGTWNEI